MRVTVALAAAVLAIPACGAQKDAGGSDKKWDVAKPVGKTREVKVDVKEGTWMSLDVSPDGKTIAFDLLGDIYVMPYAGGEAKAIASGLPWEIQPRFSPDGKHIAFTSDRGGGDNIWIMKPDGSGKRQVTKESFRLLNNATWRPDGQFIAARKHFTTARSLGTGEIWLYHISGGDGVALVERPNENHQKELGEPMFSPDGRHVYYSMNATPGGRFEYAQDSNQRLFEIRRYEMETGKIETIVGRAGGAVRPTPSPDGRYLAYVARRRAKSSLFLKDLRTGTEEMVFDALDQDMQETWAVHGVYPNMDFSPDSRTLVFWAGGKIRKLDLASRKVSVTPFHVQDTRTVIDPVRPSVEVAPDKFSTRMIRFASLSPDAKSVIFESLGKLYIKSLPDGAPRRLTSDKGAAFELFPAWSRDGNAIVFVGWDDEKLGSIRTVAASGGKSRAVTGEPGHYRRPAFSPDGSTVVYEKIEGGGLVSPEWSLSPGIYRVPAAGGEAVRITDDGELPQFGASGDRLFLTRDGGGKRQLVSVDLNGADARVHAVSQFGTAYHVSPAGTHVAVRENYNIHVMPLMPGPQSAAADRTAKALPVVKATGDGGSYPGWSQNGETLFWSLGPTLFRASVSDMLPEVPPADGATGYKPPKSGVSLTMSFPTAKPSGVTVLTGAKIISMSDEKGGVIENGTIVIRENRIDKIGPADKIQVPQGARRIDVTGKVIVPGLIDAHAHGPYGDDDVIPQQNWSIIAHLALGVTTVHDPSNTASQVFAAAELQKAGKILGPRIYSTGEIIYGAKAARRYAVINSADDARAHVRRLKAQGAHSIKNYNQPRREQRQQVALAAREANMAVVAEGGALFHMDLSMVADGNTGIEHNIPQSDLYEDVLSYYAATKVGYTPTLVVTFGGISGEDYWYQTDEVWKHKLLSLHVPPRYLQARAVRRQMAPDSDYYDQVSAATAKKLADRGVPVSIGAHGQREGLGSHWEMWSFVRGGMSPLEALRAGTIVPARHLGFANDIGSLEPGKLADLIVLDADPLKDIRNTDNIANVMLNGRLYDPKTMNETETGTAKLKPYYWQK